MINEIKKIIIDNGKFFGKEYFSEREVHISKFFHGDPATSTKILFFVSVNGEPFCILKTVRKIEQNDIIDREIEGLKHFKSLGMNVPIFFSGYFNGTKFICQEVVSGRPVGKKNQSDYFPIVAKYHNSVKKLKNIRIAEILDKIKDFDIVNDKEYDQIINLLHERRNNEICIADQHGDLTYKNLLTNGDNVIFIDFENFGLRSFWGGDITHYLVRMINVYEDYKKNKSVVETMSSFVKITKSFRQKYSLNISEKECEDLFLLDLLFEDLQRTYKKNIWLK